MANFLSGNNIVLINADKINSGNLINEFIQTDCKIHHASTSSICYQNKNYTNYYYEDFISLSNNFVQSLTGPSLNHIVPFSSNNFLKTIIIFCISELEFLEMMREKKNV